MHLAPTEAPPRPGVDEIEGERRMYADVGMEAPRRLPRAVPDPSRHVALAGAGDRVHRDPSTVAGEHEALGGEAAHTDLEPLDRRVDVARGAPGGDVLPHDVPRLERRPKGHVHNYPMGPFELADLIGLDLCLEIIRNLHESSQGREYEASLALKKLVSAGCLGRKTGRGFYQYP